MKTQMNKLSVVALGTYDKGKPRTRILLRGLREKGVDVIECHFNVWKTIEDKSQIQGIIAKVVIIWRFIIAYPLLIRQYFQLPRHDVVLIGYLGLFDVLILWPFIRLRRAVLVWDVFISLYNTVVEDRQLVGKHNPAGIAIWIMEWLALRLVDLALMDTQAHADYLCNTYRIVSEKVARIFVGAEPEAFDLKNLGLGVVEPNAYPKQVLFYGQFIPLHGIDIVVKAAKLTEKNGIRWILIGKGQEYTKIKTLVNKLQPANLKWIDWINYKDLIKYLAQSHVALGIFGTTEKAQRVIPNKVFQILMSGRPLVTANTPAILELLEENALVSLVPPGCPKALANAVVTKIKETENLNSIIIDKSYAIFPEDIGSELLTIISKYIAK